MAALKRKGRRIKLTQDSLLHFPLARLGGFDREALFQDKAFREADELILAFAHVYNDLKASFILSGVNREFQAPSPAPGQICKFFGQNVGIDHYAFRLQVGIIVELISLIKKKKHLFSDQIWIDLVKSLPTNSKRHWAQLHALAGTGTKGGFTQKLHEYLVKVRAHGGYHYYQTKPFAEGYAQHFQGEAAHTAHAFVSMGKTFEETRFFFADAAVSAISQKWKQSLGKRFDQEFERYVRSSHTAIR